MTRLAEAIQRMVDIEVTGVYREPSAARVIRTGGDPTSGACTLSTGTIVYSF